MDDALLEGGASDESSGGEEGEGGEADQSGQETTQRARGRQKRSNAGGSDEAAGDAGSQEVGVCLLLKCNNCAFRATMVTTGRRRRSGSGPHILRPGTVGGKTARRIESTIDHDPP